MITKLRNGWSEGDATEDGIYIRAFDDLDDDDDGEVFQLIGGIHLCKICGHVVVNGEKCQRCPSLHAPNNYEYTNQLRGVASHKLFTFFCLLVR